MAVVEFLADVVLDETGATDRVPVLLTESGVVEPLIHYILDNQRRSKTWKRDATRAARILLEYMDANSGAFSDPLRLFRTFASRLLSGTVGPDGSDPSGLYWIPTSTAAAKKIIWSLTALTDYLEQKHRAISMNPLLPASTAEQRLLYAAWWRKNQNNFLGHLEDRGMSDTAMQARTLNLRTPMNSGGDGVHFSEHKFGGFFHEGLGSNRRDRRAAVRDQLILVLMHYGSLRLSECFHLFVEDVTPDPIDPSKAMVRIYHPEEGRAPSGWRGPHGESTRVSYLRSEYCLIPRNRMQDSCASGWKGTVVDHDDMFMHVHFFPSDAAKLFMALWKEHLLYLAQEDRDHPWALISYSGDVRGKPYTIKSFEDAYRMACRRIGIEPSKRLGHSPHAHRHAYGRRCRLAGLPPMIIKKTMHHSSVLSQETYTQPTLADIGVAMENAVARIEKDGETATSIGVISWEDFQKGERKSAPRRLKG